MFMFFTLLCSVFLFSSFSFRHNHNKHNFCVLPAACGTQLDHGVFAVAWRARVLGLFGDWCRHCFHFFVFFIFSFFHIHLLHFSSLFIFISGLLEIRFFWPQLLQDFLKRFFSKIKTFFLRRLGRYLFGPFLFSLVFFFKKKKEILSFNFFFFLLFLKKKSFFFSFFLYFFQICFVAGISIRF